MSYRRVLASLAVLVALQPCLGQARPASPVATEILDSEAVPHLGPHGQADYRDFLLQNTPRAFAVSPDGGWGWAGGGDPARPDETAERALRVCRDFGGANCTLYAVDLAVVWPGRESAPQPPPTASVVGGPGWDVATDRRFLWFGPKRARGAYLWGHGRAAGGADSRGTEPQPHVRHFNNAGWDILRFDRAPETDETENGAVWLREALTTLRRLGYRHVVVGGQSRGAWNALQALEAGSLADAVIAIAPAAHGPPSSPARPRALPDLREIVLRAASPGARVVVVTFADDEYDPDPGARAEILRGLAAPWRTAGVLHLDRPEGMTGHGAGATWRFNRDFGACILAFVQGLTDGCPESGRPMAEDGLPMARQMRE